MASEFKTITRYVEKRTYLTGSFRGKFIGILEYSSSDLEHEAFYNLEVLEGNIKTTKDQLVKWQLGGEPKSFTEVDKFLTKIPSPIPTEISYPNGVVKYFNLDLKETKLANFRLFNQVYEKDTVFGTIEGEISGYFIHYEPEEVTVEIEPTVNTNEEYITPPQYQEEEKVLTNISTGDKQTSGPYIREKVLDTNGTPTWNDWKYIPPPKDRITFWSLLRTFFSYLFLPLLFIPLLLFGWRIFLPILIIYLLSIVLNFFRPFISSVFSFFSKFVLIALMLGFFVTLMKLFNLNLDYKKKAGLKDEAAETTIVEKDPITQNDSILSHHRIWTDYNENQYEADIKIRYSELSRSNRLRTQLGLKVNSNDDYIRLVNIISTFDQDKLDLFYTTLDSIRSQNQLSKTAFAEMVISCIQDIPYTLILEKDCNPRLYNDEFINKYLNDGGKCQGDIKYGFLTPVEFMASLDGDCDTRTLLLFTVLNHFKYDVAMLCSEMYKHSILAINLPYQGITKSIKGVPYTVWETTARGVKPGLIPPDISEMRYWNVILTSNPENT